ncbi:hypothetical protein DUK53_14420 [Listeria sp. SHR_NRA_18]|uniref:hypothetical protein n=1 Tax=Listeria sp. SHR_NRA_18 TaxID=2269046 RepID=UPI000F601B57|nr:hypothetical protein [Listeria sp. SHR_NRA_18]RQW65806.1 hypothetical protein DUK53_14420 [Listeria sp. SHR_NRA_18]
MNIGDKVFVKVKYSCVKYGEIVAIKRILFYKTYVVALGDIGHYVTANNFNIIKSNEREDK